MTIMALESLSTTSSCLVIRSSASDGRRSRESTPPTPLLPTKVVLPNKKPEKWSTGVAPGEYGGPPITTKLRKYWGGKDNWDPVTDMDGFIWNKNFLPTMQRFVRESEKRNHQKKEADSGFLSLSRSLNLDSMEIDLSSELSAPSKSVLEEQVEAARRGQSIAAENLKNAAQPKWRLAPTRREQEKWDRASKAATGGTDVILKESRRTRGNPKVLAAQSREQFYKLKKKLQFLTLGIGGVGVVSAYISYSSETAVSFAAGLAGSLIYIRMLGNSVDFSDGARGVVKGAAAQPRVLVPVALVMIYNRWNEILVPGYGFMHLDLIPMLVGFFTYKIATFAQAIEDSFDIDREAKTES